MSTLVHEYHPKGVRERFGRRHQLPRATGQTVEQENRRPVAAEVRDSEGNALAMDGQVDAGHAVRRGVDHPAS